MTMSAHILKLPDEVLVEIIGDTGHNPDRRPPKRRWFVAEITNLDRYQHRRRLARRALVCRRFYRITIPFLYKNIFMSFVDVMDPDMEDTLYAMPYRALQLNPSLGIHCRKLHLYLYSRNAIPPRGAVKETASPMQIAKNVVDWFPKLTSLSIGTTKIKEAGVLAIFGDHISQLRELQKLEAGEVKLSALYKMLQMLPNLMTVTVRNVADANANYFHSKVFSSLGEDKVFPTSLSDYTDINT